MKNKVTLSKIIIIIFSLILLFGVTYYVADSVIFNHSNNTSSTIETPIPLLKTTVETPSSLPPSSTPTNYDILTNETYENAIDYKDAMRWWVIEIAKIARERDNDFIVIPQNCAGLFPADINNQINASNYFLHIIDGIGNESLTFGLNGYNSKNTQYEINIKTSMLSIAKENGKTVLSIDYCKGDKNIAYSQSINSTYGFISFPASSIELNNIPDLNIANENFNHINKLGEAKNFLILINPEKFKSKNDYINTLTKTNYDVIIIDAFFDTEIPLTKEDINKLKVKANGSNRLVISYLSIGEAEDYRYYWNDEYYNNPPSWMLEENPNWKGNYPVKYWNEDWQNIIAKGEDSYLNKIIDAGFDGVYLDIVDGYENFEDND